MNEGQAVWFIAVQNLVILCDILLIITTTRLGISQLNVQEQQEQLMSPN